MNGNKMTEYTELDIVRNSILGKPLAVKDAVNNIMANKITDFLDQKRFELSQSIFNNKTEETDEVDDDAEMSDEEFDELEQDDDNFEADETDEEENGEDA
jgi:hypothetical protein